MNVAQWLTVLAYVAAIAVVWIVLTDYREEL